MLSAFESFQFAAFQSPYGDYLVRNPKFVVFFDASLPMFQSPYGDYLVRNFPDLNFSNVTQGTRFQSPYGDYLVRN